MIYHVQIFAQIASFVLFDKLFRRQIPSVSACHHTGVAGSHEGRQPGRLVVPSPEIVFRTAGVLYFEKGFRTVIDRCIEIIGILALRQIISHRSNLVAQRNNFIVLIPMIGRQRQENICQHSHRRLFAGTSLVIFSVTALWGKHIHRILTVR